jgi:hypothetical protein
MATLRKGDKAASKGRTTGVAPEKLTIDAPSRALGRALRTSDRWASSCDGIGSHTGRAHRARVEGARWPRRGAPARRRNRAAALLEVATSFRAELARTRRLLADPDTMGET